MAFRVPHTVNAKELHQAFLAIAKEIARVEGHVESQQLALDFPLWAFREVDGTALAAFSDGASTTPGWSYDTAIPLGIRWNNHATPDPIGATVVVPPGLSAESEVVIHVLAAKSGSDPDDATTWDIEAHFIADGYLLAAISDVGGTTNAMQADATPGRVQEVTLTIASANIQGSPSVLSLTIQPTDGTLETDDVTLHGVWLEYAGRFLEPIDLSDSPAYVYGYVFGGTQVAAAGVNDNEEFQPRPGPGTWTGKLDISFSGTCSGAAVGGKGYSLGGYASAAYNQRTLEYAPVTNLWATKATMSETKANVGACGIVAKAYSFGGFDGSLKTTVEGYTPEPTNTWATLTALGTARASAGCAGIGLFGYLFGGKPTGFETSDDTLQYSQAGDSWAAKTDLPGLDRVGSSACVSGGSAYLLGGFQDSTSANLDELLRYDVAGAGTWTVLIPMALARTRLGSFGIDNEVFAVGGYAAAHNGSVERYAVVRDSWTADTPMGVSRETAGSAAI